MKPISLAFALILFLYMGCRSEDVAKPETNADPMTEDPASYTYLALGDSYTIGHDVPEKDRYPVQLTDSLQSKGIVIEKLQIIARTGWTTDELSEAMDETELDAEYDLVTLLIGVNNQYRGRTTENYRSEFMALLTRAIKLAGGDPGKVIVLSIPDWGVTPFAQDRDREKIALEIDAYNLVNMQQSAKAGVHYVDVTPVSREAASRNELLASDGLHPSGLMYNDWMKSMFPLALQILSH